MYLFFFFLSCKACSSLSVDSAAVCCGSGLLMMVCLNDICTGSNV